MRDYFVASLLLLAWWDSERCGKLFLAENWVGCLSFPKSGSRKQKAVKEIFPEVNHGYILWWYFASLVWSILILKQKHGNSWKTENIAGLSSPAICSFACVILCHGRTAVHTHTTLVPADNTHMGTLLVVSHAASCHINLIRYCFI